MACYKGLILEVVSCYLWGFKIVILRFLTFKASGIRPWPKVVVTLACNITLNDRTHEHHHQSIYTTVHTPVVTITTPLRTHPSLLTSELITAVWAHITDLVTSNVWTVSIPKLPALRSAVPTFWGNNHCYEGGGRGGGGLSHMLITPFQHHCPPTICGSTSPITWIKPAKLDLNP